jgi:hypothetical protein
MDGNEDIIDEYIYRVPYEMLLTKFMDILDTIIKSIFTDDKYTIYIIKDNDTSQLNYKKLNKLTSFQKNITIFEKIFNKKENKIANFKLLVK